MSQIQAAVTCHQKLSSYGGFSLIEGNFGTLSCSRFGCFEPRGSTANNGYSGRIYNKYLLV